jgi:hypothetical protein
MSLFQAASFATSFHVLSRFRKPSINFNRMRETCEYLEASTLIHGQISRELHEAVGCAGIKKVCVNAIEELKRSGLSAGKIAAKSQIVANNLEGRTVYYQSRLERLTEDEQKEYALLKQSVECIRSLPKPAEGDYKRIAERAIDLCTLGRAQDALKEMRRFLEYLGYVRELHDYMDQVLPVFQSKDYNGM